MFSEGLDIGHCMATAEYNRLWRKNNRDKVLEYKRKYRQGHKKSLRKTRLSTTINGKPVVLTGLNKREYLGYCEMCGKSSEYTDEYKGKGFRLNYHHWDDNNPSKGIWVCALCHYFVEALERRLSPQRYYDLKKMVEKHYNKIN